VRLKCYIRREKFAAGRFGGLIVRLEWTLKGAAVVRHLGGNQIKDLIAADLNRFLIKNIRLQRVDHEAVGRLFQGVKSIARSSTKTADHPNSNLERWKDPGYWAQRAAFLFLRLLAYREHDNGMFPSYGCDAVVSVRATELALGIIGVARYWSKPECARIFSHDSTAATEAAGVPR